MRHLMAGSFRSYFTIVVIRRFDTIAHGVVFVDHSPFTGGRRPDRAGGPTTASAGGPDSRRRTRSDNQLRWCAGTRGSTAAAATSTVPLCDPVRVRPSAVVRNVTRLSTSSLVRCGNADIRPLPVPMTARIAAALKRGAPATMFSPDRQRKKVVATAFHSKSIRAMTRLTILLIDSLPGGRGGRRRRTATSAARVFARTQQTEDAWIIMRDNVDGASARLGGRSTEEHTPIVGRKCIVSE